MYDPFLDGGAPPSDDHLQRRLGRADVLWRELVFGVSRRLPPLSETWHFSGPSHGWLLQLARRHRTLLYLQPRDGYFVATLAGSAFEIRDRDDVLRLEHRLAGRETRRRERAALIR